MFYADDGYGNKVKARPFAAGFCPGCGEELIARCGEWIAWHWAHASGTDCDEWYEPESYWHQKWKALMRPDQVEVSFGSHRADIVVKDRIVLELQHSAISSEVIREREHFYGKMAWLIDCTSSQWRRSVPILHTWNDGSPVWVRWKHPHKTLMAACKPMFWDWGWGYIAKVLQFEEREHYDPEWDRDSVQVWVQLQRISPRVAALPR